jgi:hypothetical protein
MNEWTPCQICRTRHRIIELWAFQKKRIPFVLLESFALRPLDLLLKQAYAKKHEESSCLFTGLCLQPAISIAAGLVLHVRQFHDPHEGKDS